MMKMGKTYRRVVLIMLLMSAVLSAHASQPAAMPASWRTTPTMSECPTYQFRSTSTFTPIVGQTSYTATEVYSPAGGGPNRAKREFDLDGEEIGHVNTPVGEPLIMLVMALALLLVKVRGERLKVRGKK